VRVQRKPHCSIGFSASEFGSDAMMGGFMHDRLFALYVKFQTLASSEEGQDLVEYGLLCSLIALAVISSINPVAARLTTMFSNISSSIA